MDSIIYYGLVYFVEALIMWQYCTNMFTPKYSKFITAFSIHVIYILPFIAVFHENILLNSFLFFASNCAYIFLFYKSKIFVAVFHAILCTVLVGLTELIATGLFHELDYTFFDSPTIYHLSILAAVSKLLYFITLLLISSLFSKTKEAPFKRTVDTSLLTILPFATAFIMLTYIMLCMDNSLTAVQGNMVAISSFILLIMNIVVFAFYNYTQYRNHEFTSLQLQLQHEADSVQYYQMLIEQHENQSILIHDIKKHLNSISLLMEQKDYSRVSSYIEQLIDSPDLQEGVHICNNQMLNIILSRYSYNCREQNIKFHPDIRANSLVFINDEDLTSLFCNLLDNSIKAASKQQNSYIDLNVARRENTPFTIITVINSCRTNPFSPETGKLVSHKKDSIRHGYGIKSIKRIVKKYNGEIQMYYDEETLTFHTIIALKYQDKH